jgi:peptide/nickel transport system permease protein
LVFSVSHADYPLAQAAFLLIAIVVLVANLVVDVLYAYLDPRIRY